jgi:hypothetical protein
MILWIVGGIVASLVLWCVGSLVYLKLRFRNLSPAESLSLLSGLDKEEAKRQTNSAQLLR